MVFNKNTDLFQNICLVQIRSIDHVVDLSSLTTIYHTPSKIQYGVSSGRTDAGNSHKKTLTLSYPGLSTEDFSKFDQLIRGAYNVYIKLENDDVYEIATVEFPMEVDTTYNINTGHQLRFTSTGPVRPKFLGNQAEKPEIELEHFDYFFDFKVA